MASWYRKTNDFMTTVGALSLCPMPRAERRTRQRGQGDVQAKRMLAPKLRADNDVAGLVPVLRRLPSPYAALFSKVNLHN